MMFDPAARAHARPGHDDGGAAQAGEGFGLLLGADVAQPGDLKRRLAGSEEADGLLVQAFLMAQEDSGDVGRHRTVQKDGEARNASRAAGYAEGVEPFLAGAPR